MATRSQPGIVGREAGARATESASNSLLAAVADSWQRTVTRTNLFWVIVAVLNLVASHFCMRVAMVVVRLAALVVLAPLILAYADHPSASSGVGVDEAERRTPPARGYSAPGGRAGPRGRRRLFRTEDVDDAAHGVVVRRQPAYPPTRTQQPPAGSSLATTTHCRPHDEDRAAAADRATARPPDRAYVSAVVRVLRG